MDAVRGFPWRSDEFFWAVPTIARRARTSRKDCNVSLGPVSGIAKYSLMLDSLFRLRLAISDQNLELLPDYEQRIEVLKELSFIDDNQTVLLKGRVACEVSRRVLVSSDLC